MKRKKKKKSKLSYYCPCAESDTVRVEARSWTGHAPSAAPKYVTQVVRKLQQTVNIEIRIFPKEVVMDRTTSSLKKINI